MALIDWALDWDPWRGLDKLNRVLGSPLTRHRHYPPINVYWSTDAYGLEMEVPGVEPQDLELTVKGNVVTVTGLKKAEGREGSFHRRERPAGRFSRSVRLPAKLDPSKVEAHYQDGVLVVRLVKAPEAQARRIAVKAD